MHEPTFREALSHSWQLVIRKKSLWIFGLLSAFLGQWGLSDFIGNLYRVANEGFSPWNLSFVLDFFHAWNWHKVSVILLFLWLLGLVLLVLISVIFIAVCSRGAIIAYAQNWYKKGKFLPLNEAWNRGVAKFVPLLGVVAVSRVLQFITICLVTVVSFWLLRVDSFSHSILIVLTSAVGILCALTIESVSIFTSGYIVMENKNPWKSLRNGWELFIEHTMVSFELGIVLMLLTVLLLGVIIYGSFIAFIPAVLLWLVAGFSGWQFLIGFGMSVGVSLYIVLIMLAAGIFNAYVSCAWMYLFMKMHHEGVSSRTINFFKTLFKR